MDRIRQATVEDVPLILSMIKALAEYERMPDAVTADEATLRTWLFEREAAEVIFALEGEQEVGYALTFHNFSTFEGRAGLYLEDLFVLPAYRGRGHGIRMLKYLAKRAVERGCARFEWTCLDWNQPSRDLYASIGAVPLEEWLIYRLDGERLAAFASDQVASEGGEGTKEKQG